MPQLKKELAGIPGTFPCADDDKVQGSSAERHDIDLLETAEKARKAGLKFNPNKCFTSIKKQQIGYFGRIINPQGVQPCPRAVKAITALAPPTDKQGLPKLAGNCELYAYNHLQFDKENPSHA